MRVQQDKAQRIGMFVIGKKNIFKAVRRMAEKGFAPTPLGNFADISYLVEN